MKKYVITKPDESRFEADHVRFDPATLKKQAVLKDEEKIIPIDPEWKVAVRRYV